MAHLPRPYSDPQYDGLHVQLSYTDDQDYPSPALMPEYELNLFTISIAHFFLTHKEMPPAKHPCFNGSRVRAHDTRKDQGWWIEEVAHAFTSADIEEVEPFSYTADSLDKSRLVAMRDLCTHPEVRPVIAAAKAFQRDSVRKYNPFADEVTMTNYMGMVV